MGRDQKYSLQHSRLPHLDTPHLPVRHLFKDHKCVGSNIVSRAQQHGRASRIDLEPHITMALSPLSCSASRWRGMLWPLPGPCLLGVKRTPCFRLLPREEEVERMGKASSSVWEASGIYWTSRGFSGAALEKGLVNNGAGAFTDIMGLLGRVRGYVCRVGLTGGRWGPLVSQCHWGQNFVF